MNAIPQDRARSAVVDMGLVIGAVFFGVVGAGVLGLAGYGVLARAVGPLASAGLWGAVLVLLSVVTGLVLRSRQRQSAQALTPALVPADPGAFAIFLIGFVLARRILARR